ncbi:MAG: nucleotide excision repair endonuclease [Candidatus Pacebacteria bacterium]|nr:nucleotide excision repair endonuclease [Candidatus Paceibacterota bacterium]
MTTLEKQTFTDGFFILLLGVHSDTRRNILAFQATLFDGGRYVDRLERHEPFFGPAPDFAISLRRFVHKVLCPPNVLVVYGYGWRDLLTQCLGALTSELRILDLGTTAAALQGNLTGQATLQELAGAYKVSETVISENAAFSPAAEELLWAVIGAAGARNWDWTDLLGFAHNARAGVPFTRYRCDSDSLTHVPRAPGVYIMRTEAGDALYVGKSVNLASRMQDYFGPALQVSDKHQALRQRTHDIELRLVGSELEALLLENKLIKTLHPQLNSKCTVNPGAARHPSRHTSTVILAPSSDEKRRELFFFGHPGKAVQLTVRPERLPRKSLETLLAYFAGPLAKPRRTRAMIDWGTDGNEICQRYHSRFKHLLCWLDLPLNQSTDVLADAVTQAVKISPQTSDPTEFRLPD